MKDGTKPSTKKPAKKPAKKTSTKKPGEKKPSEYNKFVSKLRKEGKTMAEAAKLWKARK